MASNRIRTLAAVFAGAFFLANCNVNAVITLGLESKGGPNPVIGQIYHFDQSKNPGSDGIRNALATLGRDPETLGGLLYKGEPSNKEEGILKGSYKVVYNPSNGEGTATITWTGPDIADASYLLAKSGSKGGHYLWDLSGWDGIEIIQIEDVFKKNAFSHIEFYGREFEGTVVPEPSTFVAGALLLVPFGVSAFRILRKRNAAVEPA